MSNKKVTRILPLFVSVALLSGCGGNNVSEENVIRIQTENGGYGITWVQKLKEKFEALYSKEGYKVNILDAHESQAAETDYNALTTGANTDIYFSSDLLVDRVANNKDYGQLVEDITDEVYAKPAIKFDGTEESETISTKLGKANGFFDEQYKYNNRAYCFFYQRSIGGLVYNKAKLDSFGLSAPKTTNELYKTFETIHEKKVSGESLYQPLTLVGSSPTNGYPNCFLDALVTQYSGVSFWDKVWSLQKDDGTKMDKQDALDTYSDAAFNKSIEAIYRIYDSNNTCDGSSNFKLETAHQYLADSNEAQRKGGAVFMADGDWMYNETVKKAKVAVEKADNLRIINFPVISALGTKLWGGATSHNATDEQCENTLKAIIDLVDNGKTVDEIVTSINAGSYGVTITKDEATTVAKARGTYVSRGGETGTAYISKKSTKKDICYKFLRMFASDDFGAVYHEETNGFSPYSSTSSSSSKEYFKSYEAIINHPYANGIWSFTKGYRKECGTMNDLLMLNGSRVCHNIYSSKITGYDDQGKMSNPLVYTNAANELMTSEVNHLDQKWSTWAK